MNVTFDHAEPVAPGITTFWFKPEKPVDYIAGQFTELYLPHDNPDSRGVRRWFTLSSSPTDPLVSITTKLAPQQGSSFKQALTSLQPGAPLKLADPMGDFVLPKDAHTPLTFIAAGLGVTPMHSMVKWLQDTGEARAVTLLYAAHSDTELTFMPLFTSYQLNLITIVKQPTPAYQGVTGELTASRILQLAGNNPQALYYLAGPELLVEAFTKELPAHGLDPQRLVTDYFPGYASI